MFKCYECGLEFEVPKFIDEREGEYFRTYAVCPNCEGVFGDYEKKCVNCIYCDEPESDTIFWCPIIADLVNTEDEGCCDYVWDKN